MKLAIMQPYLFPYIGYFQLIHAADRFVFYDDVNFIKQGWINRNNILKDGKPLLFSVPLKDPSSNTLICDTGISGLYRSDKFLKTLKQVYSKAPYYPQVAELLSDIISTEEKKISGLAIRSVKKILKFLGTANDIRDTSSGYLNTDLKGQERVIDICKQENATHYINPSGGKELYSKEAFNDNGITLQFLQSEPKEYLQFDKPFVPNLSIIDVLMFNSIREITGMLDNFQIQ